MILTGSKLNIELVAAIRKHTDVTDIEFLEHYEGTKPEPKKQIRKKALKSLRKKSTRRLKSNKFALHILTTLFGNYYYIVFLLWQVTF